MSRRIAFVLAGFVLAPPAHAERANTRYTQELDSAEWNVGHPYDFRVSTRYDLYLASMGNVGGGRV
jgi:hypothetical protein